MKKYIIVKYAEDNFPDGIAPFEYGVFGTYSANQCGVIDPYYTSIEDAEKDLKALTEFNPTVYYGIVEGV